MSIIRVKKRDRYAAISNSLLRDKKLSFAARGLMGYLLSKPDDWQVSTEDLIEQSPAGRDAVQHLIQELKINGYMERVRTREEGGTFSYETLVYEEPRTPLPSTANPVTVQPSTVEPSTVNPSTYVIQSNEELNKEKDRGLHAKRAAPHLPDEEFLDSLQAKPAYAALDVRLVYSKMSVWCEAKGKQPTRMRLINWLNREDQPMNGNGNGNQTSKNYTKPPVTRDYSKYPTRT